MNFLTLETPICILYTAIEAKIPKFIIFKMADGSHLGFEGQGHI